MIGDRESAGPHADDGALLALHDNESVESPEVLVHVDGCSECQARLERIRAESNVVRSALRAVPVPSFDAATLRRELSERRAIPVATTSRWRRPAIQIAAALAVATVAAASVGPIRKLIVRRSAPAEVTPASGQVPTPRPIPRSGTTISFSETGPVFTVRFDSTPAGGSLELDRATSPAVVSAQAMAVAGDSADAMVVLPHELRLRNAAASTVGYRIMIPVSVERVRVVVAGRTLFDGVPRRARIALSSGRPE